jgi:adenylylsulfate kinase
MPFDSGGSIHRKILIMGLPGAGKTTLANILAQRLNAVHFNANEVRKQINKDLGFSEADRIEHAGRMGWLCDQVIKTGSFVIADFVCPTPDTRRAFMKDRPAFVVWVDRVQTSAFEDTNRLFVPPETYDLRVTRDGSVDYWAEQIVQRVRPVFDPKQPTALFVGRYQPFHEGHRALVCEGLRRVGQVCIAVRNTAGMDGNNPLGFEQVRARIEDALHEFAGRFVVVPLPNITHIFYGRSVGYAVERIELNSTLEQISGTEVRQRLALNGPQPGRDG